MAYQDNRTRMISRMIEESLETLHNYYGNDAERIRTLNEFNLISFTQDFIISNLRASGHDVKSEFLVNPSIGMFSQGPDFEIEHKGEILAAFEGVILKYVNTDKIKNHVEKLVHHANIKGIPDLYATVYYCNHTDTLSPFWTRYIDFLEETYPQFTVIDDMEVVEPIRKEMTAYGNMGHATMKLMHHGKLVTLHFFAVSMYTGTFWGYSYKLDINAKTSQSISACVNKDDLENFWLCDLDTFFDLFDSWKDYTKELTELYFWGNGVTNLYNEDYKPGVYQTGSQTIFILNRIYAEHTELMIPIILDRICRYIKPDVLDIRFLDSISVPLRNLHELEVLRINRVRHVQFNYYELEQLHRLQILDLDRTDVEKVPDLSIMPDLVSLYLRNTKIKEVKVSSIHQNLKHLSVNGTEVSDAGFLKNLPALERLTLRRTKIRKLPDGKELSKSLIFFGLSKTKLESCPDLRSLVNLRTLDFVDTDLEEIPESYLPENIERLYLSSNKYLRRLPDSIGHLESLQILDLQNMELETLPKTFSNLNLPYFTLHASKNVYKDFDKSKGIFLNNTKILDIDVNILEENRLRLRDEKIAQFLDFESDLQSLLYQLYRIDQMADTGKDKVAEQKPENETSEETVVGQNTSTTGTIKTNYTPSPADLELATRLVVASFEEWITNKSKEKGNTFAFAKLSEEVVQELTEYTESLEGASIDTTKHAHRQTTGLQFGYDIGMNTSVNGTKYRLCFECKNYTSLNADETVNSKTTLKIDSYAYNLIQFYMHCRKDIENRWILVCPFGDLGNDFQEKLFDEWNKDHPFMQISAFTQKQTGMTCAQFLSINPEAFKKVYRYDVPDNLIAERENYLQNVYEMLIGKHGVEKNALAKLKEIGIPDDFLGHGKLMSVQTEEERPALESALSLLTSTDKQGVYIVGEYGSGKTWLSCQIIEEIIRKNRRYPFYPVYASLKKNTLAEIDTDEMDIDKISGAADTFIADFPSDKLIEFKSPNLQKKILFVLDGFDEVLSGLSATDNKIEFLYNIYTKLQAAYGSSARFLITSRESDYTACANHDDFTKIIEDFDTIHLEECNLKDACESLKAIAAQPGTNKTLKQQFENVDVNSNLVRLAQRPVILSLIRQIAPKANLRDNYKDEFDILKDVVDHSVENTVENKTKVIEELEKHALKMSRENKLEIEVDETFEKLIHNGAISIIHLESKEDFVRYLKFHHNIIREYLVASHLFRALGNDPKAGTSPNTTLKTSGKFLKTLASMQLTPEMQRFFHRFIENDVAGAEYIRLLERTLEKDTVKRNKKMASALFSLLMQPDRSLQGTARKVMKLSGIQMEDLNIWNCTLENIDMQNAVISNMHLLDVTLANIDFRNANLEKLRLGSDMPLSDIYLHKKGSKHLVNALYEGNQVVEYTIDNLTTPEKYKPDSKEWNFPEDITFTKLGMADKKMFLYNERLIYLPETEEIPYSLESGKEILQIGKTKKEKFIVYEGMQDKKIVFYDESGDSERTVPLEGDASDLCVLNEESILFKSDRSIAAIDLAKPAPMILLSFDNLESFAARMSSDSEMTIYAKDGKILHRIIMNANQDIIEKKEWNIEGKIKGISKQMYFVADRCLCITNANTIYLLKIEGNTVHSYPLQTKVNCKDLYLENEDGTCRIGDAAAYELLSRYNKKTSV